MATKDTKPGYDFIVSVLQKDKTAAYSDISAAAEKKGLLVYPIMYGRAKAALGLVKSKPRGQGKAAGGKKRASKGASMAGRRGPGRPRKNQRTGGSMSSLESIVAAVKDNEQAMARYRGALEKIQSILVGVLD